ncbi:MAG: hypothetical protein ACKO8I_17785 [Cyanobacteriota bacterium]
MAGWTLQPRVLLRARYAAGELLIEQLESRVQGLGAWQERLSFGLEARIRPGEDPERGSAVLEAEARVWAELPAAAVAASPWANRIPAILAELRQRCGGGTVKRLQQN